MQEEAAASAAQQQQEEDQQHAKQEHKGEAAQPPGRAPFLQQQVQAEPAGLSPALSPALSPPQQQQRQPLQRAQLSPAPPQRNGRSHTVTAVSANDDEDEDEDQHGDDYEPPGAYDGAQQRIARQKHTRNKRRSKAVRLGRTCGRGARFGWGMGCVFVGSGCV